MSARSRVLLALSGVFAFGCALGVAGDRLWLAPRPAAVAANPMESADALVAVMQREVGLDESQARSVRAILARHQSSVDSAWRAVRPNVHRAIGEAQMEIAVLLRPDQRARYLRWVQSAHRGL
jgi:hypothetical protein